MTNSRLTILPLGLRHAVIPIFVVIPGARLARGPGVRTSNHDQSDLQDFHRSDEKDLRYWVRSEVLGSPPIDVVRA